MRYLVTKPCGHQGVTFADGSTISDGVLDDDAARSLKAHGCLVDLPDDSTNSEDDQIAGVVAAYVAERQALAVSRVELDAEWRRLEVVRDSLLADRTALDAEIQAFRATQQTAEPTPPEQPAGESATEEPKAKKSK